jgi:hypothetical protein
LTVAQAVADGDLDELVRWVDRLCDAQDWDGLVELRDRARRAYEQTGRQLWPAASLAEYRLALDGPAELAAAMLVEGTGHLALGPLPEVAASTHTWMELAPHVVPGPPAWTAAHERVTRGEDLTGTGVPGDVPLKLAPWEPAYLAPVYKPSEVDPGDPPLPDYLSIVVPDAPDAVAEPATAALVALVERWKTGSNGTVAAVAVEGTAVEAVAALAPGATVGWVDVDVTDAVLRMAWAASSGGAHGRRRGAAAGRFDALWAVAALCGLTDDWPVPADELGDAASELRWHLWRPAGLVTGWALHLAVDDPADGLAWALAATDHAEPTA